MHNYPGPGMPPAREEPRRGARRIRRPGACRSRATSGSTRTTGATASFTDKLGLYGAYLELIIRLRGLVGMGLSAAVYTQTTDCEVEVNGLMTYDRAVVKLPVESVAEDHKSLYRPLPTIKVLLPTAQTSPQLWSYTIKAPGLGWIKPEFDDSAWPTGESGFGTKATPGAIVHTEWKTGDIWLRRSFELDSNTSTVRRSSSSITTKTPRSTSTASSSPSSRASPRPTSLVPLTQDAAGAFKPGKNVIAVHCHQTGGGQYIDVGLVDFVEPGHRKSQPATASPD